MILAFAIVVAQPGAAGLAEAYRLDRLRTKALNDAALNRLQPSGAAVLPSPTPRVPSPAELDLVAREQRAVQAWRVRQAACAAGQRSSCD